MRKGYHGPLRRAREMLPGSSPLKDGRNTGESCTETYISVRQKFFTRGKVSLLPQRAGIPGRSVPLPRGAKAKGDILF